ncbi:MAG: dihydrodipicolinate reductase C-terminal domain-containing protein [Candidatus Aenigmarchaeota archaeon]|nr:dihydrodipicolinate reductase C-terminal domain-containing protein [Candidatus Aenigmarchaeota archaeon]
MKTKYPSYGDLIVVDFSKGAVNQNAELYCEYELPFFMGATAGDRAKLEETIRQSKVSAVVAPNAGRVPVIVQAIFEYLAREFPSALKGYEGHIDESHQQTKPDPSGTALKWKPYLEEVGIKFDDMKSIRDDETQMSLGVPKKYLGGHGYHWITVRGNNVTLEINTKVNGRTTYGEGTVDGVRFLHKKVKEGSRGQVYSMVDAIKGV